MNPVGTSPPPGPQGAQNVRSPRATAITPGGMRAAFSGSGSALKSQLLGDLLLTLVTLGVYGPWFVAKLTGHIYSQITFGPTRHGRLRFSFTGTGGELFELGLRGLLVPLTLGLYSPWHLCAVLRYWADHSLGTAEDGTQYRLKFSGTGAELLGPLLGGGLLVMISLGLYTPWFLCRMQRLLLTRTAIYENGRPAGAMDFVGSGGALFGTFLRGALLCLITLGLYTAWFQVTLRRYFLQNTRVTVHGATIAGDFTGAGGEQFVIYLGGPLIPLTLGIYLFWFLAKQLRFELGHTVYRPIAA